MEIGSIVKFVLIVIAIPLFFWLRVRTINKRKKGSSVRCPYCGLDQRLDLLANYDCKSCKKSVDFFDQEGTPLPDIRYYNCEACGERNFEGVITCTACGLANPEGIPG